jgi:hypothetical protein
MIKQMNLYLFSLQKNRDGRRLPRRREDCGRNLKRK